MVNTVREITDYMERQVVADDLTLADSQANLLQQSYPGIQQMDISGNRYYTLPDPNNAADMGASEKILLISEDKLQQTLAGSDSATPIKLKPDAILKLPKHGQVDQVLQEAMALGISSQAYGLKTASCTMVCYSDKPALFVPFDDMQPLSAIAHGEVKHRKDGKVEHRDSTLRAMGDGLQSNMFYDDFGSAFGLSYLTGDADGVGGYNQNKGFQGRSLFVFDQAVKHYDLPHKQNLFYTDTRLRNIPTTVVGGKIRHTNGRNFSLIEDGSIAAKYDSMSRARTNRVVEYCRAIIARLIAGRDSVPPHLAKQHELLINTARNAARTIQDRIDDFEAMMPKAEAVPKSVVKSAIVLENLMNKPRFFAKDGRPYRGMYTKDRYDVRIKQINQIGDNVRIEFDKSLSDNNVMALLRRFGLNATNISPRKSRVLNIRKDQLANIERVLYPEQDPILQEDYRYFNYLDLKYTSQGYGKIDPRVKDVINDYLSREVDAETGEDIIDNLQIARQQLAEIYGDTKSDRGFINHIAKKLEFETQRQLLAIVRRNVDPEIGDKQAEVLKKAFATAVKLDCMKDYNNMTVHLARQAENGQISAQSIEMLTQFASLDETTVLPEQAMEMRANMCKCCVQIQANIVNERSTENRLLQRDFRDRYKAICDADNDKPQAEAEAEVEQQDLHNIKFQPR